MSIRIMTNVWEHAGITPTQKLVLLALADWANDEGLCWPSINRLAAKSCLTPRCIQKTIRSLEDCDLIRREEVTGKGNRYWITLPMNDVHPCPTFTPPMNEVHPTPEPRSPNTSYTHQDTSNEMSSDDDKVTVDEVVRAWNELADHKRLPRVAKLTSSRRKQIQSLIREYNVDDWSTAMTAINNSKFLCGENERGWKANFDFLLQPKSFVKLIEGAYNK
jgi:hypothetical protein